MKRSMADLPSFRIPLSLSPSPQEGCVCVFRVWSWLIRALNSQILAKEFLASVTLADWVSRDSFSWSRWMHQESKHFITNTVRKDSTIIDWWNAVMTKQPQLNFTHRTGVLLRWYFTALLSIIHETLTNYTWISFGLEREKIYEPYVPVRKCWGKEEKCCLKEVLRKNTRHQRKLRLMILRV